MDLPKDINSTFVWLDTLSDPYSDDSIARKDWQYYALKTR